jgi:hypothetical protein
VSFLPLSAVFKKIPLHQFGFVVPGHGGEYLKNVGPISPDNGLIADIEGQVGHQEMGRLSDRVFQQRFLQRGFYLKKTNLI